MSRRKTHEMFLADVAGRPFDVLGTYQHNTTPIKLRCHIDGHVWTPKPCNIISGKGCPECKSREQSDRQRKSNRIIECRGTSLLIDISTPRHKNSTMMIDRDDWIAIKDQGRVHSDARGYCVQRRGNTMKKIHRIILRDPDADIDHINNNQADNRRENLRITTHVQNCMNVPKKIHNTSGRTGVSIHRQSGKWRATIMVNNVHISLGLHRCFCAAVKAREAAEIKYFGEYRYKGE